MKKESSERRLNHAHLHTSHSWPITVWGERDVRKLVSESYKNWHTGSPPHPTWENCRGLKLPLYPLTNRSEADRGLNRLWGEPRQTVMINYKAAVGRGPPEGWTVVKCWLLFLLLGEGEAGLSNDKMSTFSRLWQWKTLPSSPESFVLNFISTSHAKITC